MWSEKTLTLEYFASGKNSVRPQLRYCFFAEYVFENNLFAVEPYDYRITKDKTYELVFRRAYQKEIEQFVPDIKNEIRKLIGKS